MEFKSLLTAPHALRREHFWFQSPKFVHVPWYPYLASDRRSLCCREGRPYSAETETLGADAMGDQSHGRPQNYNAHHQNLNPRQLTAKLSAASTVDELLRLHETHGDSFDHFHLSAAWSRLKALRPIKDQRRLAPLCDQSVRMLRGEDVGARAMANVAHAAAKCKLRGPAANSLFDALATASAARANEFSSQELATTAWAYATANQTAPSLFQALATASEARVHEFDPQALANMAWAYATAGHAAPSLFDALAKTSAARVHEFDPQALANTAWAYATAGHAAPSLFNALATASAARVHEFNCQGLASTAWAFATAGHVDPSLFKALAMAAMARVDDFYPQGLANTAWAFATVGLVDPSLFDVLATASAKRVDEFDSQALANTAWAYATVNHAAPLLFDALAKASTARVNAFSPQELANTTWAFAVANVDAGLTVDIVEACKKHERAFKVPSLCQLHQVALWCEERGGDRALQLSAALCARCREAFVRQPATPSRLQSQVAGTLRAMGLRVVEEVRTKQGYSLDIVVQIRRSEMAHEVDVAIEVDGPHHFWGRRIPLRARPCSSAASCDRQAGC